MKMTKAHLLLGLSSCLSLLCNACGAGDHMASQQQGADVSLSSAAMYQTLFNVQNKKKFTESLPSLRQRSVAAYYQSLTAQLDNSTVVLAGYEVTGLRDRLRAQKTMLAALAGAYPTMGELWDAAGVDLTRWPSAAEFTASLREALGPPAATRDAAPARLGLVTDNNCPDSYTVITPPIAQALNLDGHDRDYVIDVAAFGKSYAMDTKPGTAGGDWIQSLDAAFVAKPGRHRIAISPTVDLHRCSSTEGPPEHAVPGPVVHYKVEEVKNGAVLGKLVVYNYADSGKAVIERYHPALLPENATPPAGAAQ